MKDRFHWPEYLCEFLGTALMVLIGLSAIALDFGQGSPVVRALPSPAARLFLTGCLFSAGGTMVTYSYLGKRSGAHINPAVTFLFWLMKKATGTDAAFYVVAQCAGALAAAVAAKAMWGPWALSTHLGVTLPGTGVSGVGAFAAEAVMTAILGLVILAMLSRTSTMKWTGVVAGVVVVLLVFFGAPISGTSINPARSLGPALVLPNHAFLWLYILAPLAGAALADGLFSLAARKSVICAKLFHTFDVRCIFCGFHPDAAPASSTDPVQPS